ncbi:uncharacterized protein LOC122756485 [Drosophila santomea]|uniref:uncharacterized protein LOC122756485 n=1 Tax=Drosophila santomea TaxID=129105 RepID=UPI001CCFBD10|nr:uncharacterized protein LOC122756485 [Drosophila santomea]
MSLQGLGHSSIGRDMSSISDYIVTRTCPDVRTTTFMGPDDWKTGQDHAQHLNIYTDGSKMEGGVGAGIYCTDPEMRLSYKLPSQCSIFQAEVFAIGKAAELALSIDRPHEAVNLFVDSQAAIRSMQSSAVSSKSVLASREALDILSTTTSVRIYWVPSHQSIDGNETADELAKEGVGSENVPVSLRTRTEKTGRRTSQKQMEKNFHHLQNFKNHVQYSKRHCLAAAHAVKLGITDNARCRKCDESEAIETLEHLICKCPALTRARINYLGAPVLASLEDALRKKPGELLAFAKNSSILEYFDNRENILSLKMGGKESKASDNTAVINTVKVIDHKDEILDVQHTLVFIAVMLMLLALLILVIIYKRSEQRRRDHHHSVERIVSSIPQHQ